MRGNCKDTENGEEFSFSFVPFPLFLRERVAGGEKKGWMVVEGRFELELEDTEVEEVETVDSDAVVALAAS